MYINKNWKFILYGVLAVVAIFLVVVGITCAKYGIDFKAGVAKIFGIAQQVAEQTADTVTETSASAL